MHYDNSKAHNGVGFDGRGNSCVGVAHTHGNDLAGHCLFSQ